MGKGKGPIVCPTPWCGGYGEDMCGDPDCTSCVGIMAHRAKGQQEPAWCYECCRVVPYIHERPKHPNLRARAAGLFERLASLAHKAVAALRAPER